MPKSLFLSFVLLYGGAAGARGQEAVKDDPEHHKVELENDQVRVVRVVYPVGYESPLHDNLPGINITSQDRTWEAVYQGQPKTAPALVKAGTAGGLSSAGPLHTAKNVGASNGEAIRVELKTKL